MSEEASLSNVFGLSRAQARAAWQSTRDVVLADGEPGERSRELLAVLARALAVGPDEPRTDPSTAFPTEKERRTLVDALVIPACIEGEVSRARERAVLDLAARLGVRSHWAALLPALRARRVLSVKRALASRSPDARRVLARGWQEEGLFGLVRVLIFVVGLHRDAALARRFHELAACAEGTFGRAVADHFRTRGLAFPGEKNGMPERMIHHDLLHVLNGYDTDATGECELAAFYAAFTEGDGFTFFVIVLATFHLGLRVSPSVVVPARGAFDPERALAAFIRGRGMRVDVTGRWNYWDLMPLPIDEVRITLGIGVGPRSSG